MAIYQDKDTGLWILSPHPANVRISHVRGRERWQVIGPDGQAIRTEWGRQRTPEELAKRYRVWRGRRQLSW